MFLTTVSILPLMLYFKFRPQTNASYRVKSWRMVCLSVFPWLKLCKIYWLLEKGE